MLELIQAIHLGGRSYLSSRWNMLKVFASFGYFRVLLVLYAFVFPFTALTASTLASPRESTWSRGLRMATFVYTLAKQIHVNSFLLHVIYVNFLACGRL